MFLKLQLPQISKLYYNEYPVHSTTSIRQYVVQKRDIPCSKIANQPRMYSVDYLPKEDSYFTKMVKKIWSKQLTESVSKFSNILHNRLFIFKYLFIEIAENETSSVFTLRKCS